MGETVQAIVIKDVVFSVFSVPAVWFDSLLSCQLTRPLA